MRAYQAAESGHLEFYRRAVALLQDAGIGFLVGGAYAFSRYTGICRDTKDFDIFLRPDDCPAAIETFVAAGFDAEVTFPHWLGKVYCGDRFVDLIFSAGNGVARVDDQWFAHSEPDELFGLPVYLCPREEMIWSKAFIMERERYDGADVAHLLRAQADRLDWRRLLERFGPHWRVLFSHLVLFGFVYPGERDRLPQWVMSELASRLEREVEASPPPGRLCQGTLISREQYLVDIEEWGYEDARVPPHGSMSRRDADRWTDAIEEGPREIE